MEEPRPPLPCYPCPHGSACCAYGVSVTEEEAVAIAATFGVGVIYWDQEEQEHRTRVEAGYCTFHDAGRCLIHDGPYYPQMCRGFPWLGADGIQPYEFDVDICPEMIARPDLVAFLDEDRRRLRRQPWTDAGRDELEA
jgi:hypothetical protein